MNRTRFMLRIGFAALVMLLVLAALAAWQQWRVLDTHDVLVREQLRATQRVVEAQYRDVLHTRAELVAGDPAFAGYVEQAIGGVLPGTEIDTTSIVDLLRERQSQLGLVASAVLDRNGRVIASTADFGPAGTLQGDPLFERAQADLTVASGVRPQGDALLHVAIVPLAAVGVSEGFLVVGLPLDLGFAQDIATASGADALLQAAADGPVVSSTLDAGSVPPALTTAGSEALSSIEVDGVARPLTALPLFQSDRGRLLLLSSAGPRSALVSALRLPWITLAAVLLLALAMASVLLWRRVMRPVDAVIDCLDRAAVGDYRLQVPDAVAGSMRPLAAAFNRLMSRLAA